MTASAPDEKTTPTVPAAILALVADWNSTYAALDALWESEGQPPPAAWRKIASPLFDRRDDTEARLAPLLFQWATAHDFGSVDSFGWCAIPSGNEQIRKQIGLNGKWSDVRSILNRAVHEARKRAWDEKVRWMSDDEFATYIDNSCAITPEGQNTKEFLLALRAEYDAERTATA